MYSLYLTIKEFQIALFYFYVFHSGDHRPVKHIKSAGHVPLTYILSSYFLFLGAHSGNSQPVKQWYYKDPKTPIFFLTCSSRFN